MPSHTGNLERMAKEASEQKKSRRNKSPGRIAQMWQVFLMTKKYDSSITIVLLAALIIPIGLSVAAAVLLSGGILGWILWIISGVLIGVLLMMIILGRRAEKVAFMQIEGQPGAVGAIVKSALRRSWTGSEVPVAVSPKTQDAVYRVVGRGGVVLIAEGPKSRTQRLLSDEERKVRKVLPAVPVTHLFVGPDADSVPLHKINAKLLKIKPVLRKQEVMVVAKRLSSLKASPIGIPKGIDPSKMRAPRPR